MEETPRETIELLGEHADKLREHWRLAGLLVRALADDPDVEAVLTLFQLLPGMGGSNGPADPDALARGIPALGRALRKIVADGGPDIESPSYLLAMFGNGAQPSEIPRFKDGEPVEKRQGALAG